MSLDVREGDVLVLDGQEYPIKSVGEWAFISLSHAMRRMLRYTCSTLRNPVVVNGKRGMAETHLTDLRCTALDPVSPELRSRLGLETPHELKQVFAVSSDGYAHIIVEELKR